MNINTNIKGINCNLTRQTWKSIKSYPCWRNRNRTGLVDEDLLMLGKEHESSIADAASSRFSTPKHSPMEVEFVCESWCCCTCKQRLDINPCSFNFLSHLELWLNFGSNWLSGRTRLSCTLNHGTLLYIRQIYIAEYKWTI